MKSVTASPWISLALKLIGALLVLTSLIDYTILLTTAKFQDPQWGVTFTTQVVDRGFIPLVGIALILLSYWLESAMGVAEARTTPALRLAALVVASILGIFFLVAVPWNVLATRDASAAQVKQVNDEAGKAKSQLDAQIQQFKSQGSQQLEFQLAQVEQAISSGQLKAEQLTQAQAQRDQLKKLKSDPKALEAQLETQLGPKRKEELDRVENRRKELEEQTQGTAMRSALRTGLDSLLWAIGYIFIGWTGLRQTLSVRN